MRNKGNKKLKALFYLVSALAVTVLAYKVYEDVFTTQPMPVTVEEKSWQRRVTCIVNGRDVTLVAASYDRYTGEFNVVPFWPDEIGEKTTCTREREVYTIRVTSDTTDLGATCEVGFEAWQLYKPRTTITILSPKSGPLDCSQLQ